MNKGDDKQAPDPKDIAEEETAALDVDRKDVEVTEEKEEVQEEIIEQGSRPEDIAGQNQIKKQAVQEAELERVVEWLWNSTSCPEDIAGLSQLGYQNHLKKKAVHEAEHEVVAESVGNSTSTSATAVNSHAVLPGAYALDSRPVVLPHPSSGYSNTLESSIQPMPTPSPPRESLPGAHAVRRCAAPNDITESETTAENSSSMNGNSSRDHNLVRARLVVAEEEDLTLTNLPKAEHVPPGQEQQTRRTQQLQAVVVAFTLVAAAVGTGLAVHFHNKTGKTKFQQTTDGSLRGSATDLASNNSLAPRDRLMSLLPDYSRQSIIEGPELGNEKSPQSKALEWVLRDPNLDQYPEQRILQRFALATFYHATSGDSWFDNTHWLDYQLHECQWHVFSFEAFTLWQQQMEQQGSSFSPMNAFAHDGPCNSNGTFEFLWLTQNELQGTIPPELYLLSSLRSLYLAFNANLMVSFHVDPYRPTNSNLDQTHQPQQTRQPLLAQLTNLEMLSLGPNQKLNEKIPTELGLLTKLKLMAIWGNQGQGPLPTELGSLTQLTFLGISDRQYNAITGTIPSELGNLVHLRALYLKGNSMTGKIPTELWNLGNRPESTFVFLDVRENPGLSGIIPTDACQGIRVLLHDCTDLLCGCNCNCSVAT